MKNKILTLSIFTVLGLAGMIFESSVSASYDAGPSVSGHGNYTEADGELRTFSVHARTQRGVTKGSFVVNNRSNGHFLKGTINCLNIEGNRATMSGVITSSSVEDLVPVGTLTRFGVVDNGEGEGDAADRMSRFNNFTSATCATPVTVHSLAVEGGNIQVRP